jgi:hypothetical protein
MVISEGSIRIKLQDAPRTKKIVAQNKARYLNKKKMKNKQAEKVKI